MNKKSINVFGFLYILLLSINVLIIFIIFNWINTLYYIPLSYEQSLEILVSDINFQINIALLGTLLMIISAYLLFKKNLKLSSTFGFIGNILQLILYFSPPIVLYGQHGNMKPEELILFTNEFRSISVFYLLCICLIFIINIIPLLYNRFKPDLQEIVLIRKTILDLGTKFPRLQVKEIAENCKINLNTKIEVDTIIKIIRDMITNNEIYAQYFKSTKSVAFDQQANIKEIDRLMNMYSKWEDKEKKIN